MVINHSAVKSGSKVESHEDAVYQNPVCIFLEPQNDNTNGGGPLFLRSIREDASLELIEASPHESVERHRFLLPECFVLPHHRLLEPDEKERLRSLFASALSSQEMLETVTSAIPPDRAAAITRASDPSAQFAAALAYLLEIQTRGPTLPVGASRVAPAPAEGASKGHTLPAPGVKPVWAERAKYPVLAKLNAVQFYEEVWGEFHSLLYLDSLRERDDKLERAIRAYCAEHRLKASQTLPPPASARTTELAGEVAADHALATKRVVDRERKAAWRASGKHKAHLQPK